MAFKKIGACWHNKSKGYTCKLNDDISLKGGDKFQLFKNEHKSEDKHPDLILGIFDDKENVNG